MGVKTSSQAAFAALFIGLGIQGLITRDFTTVWQPVPRTAPLREVLVYACALLSLTAGVGLLVRRTAAVAARALLVALCVWLVVWRLRPLFTAALIESTWSLADTLVMTAGAWVLFAWLASKRDRDLRIARVLYGLGMIPFGYAHFANVPGTAGLVPHWLPWHVGWAYFTGATFVAAGIAILVGAFARLAAALSAVQMGLFGLLIWVPILMSGPTNAFQRMEFATTVALTIAGWVVADSYRGVSL